MTTTPTTQEEPFWLTLLRWGFKAAWWATRWLVFHAPLIGLLLLAIFLSGTVGGGFMGTVTGLAMIGGAGFLLFSKWDWQVRRIKAAWISERIFKELKKYGDDLVTLQMQVQVQPGDAEGVYRVQVSSNQGHADSEVENMLDVIASDMGASISRVPTGTRQGVVVFDLVLRDPLAEPLTDKAPVLVNPPQSAHGPMTVGVDQIGSPVKLQLYSKQQGGTRIFVAGRSGSGKNSTPTQFLMGAVASGAWDLYLADPKRTEFNWAKDHAVSYASDPEGIVSMLERLQEQMHQRQQQVADSGKQTWDTEQHGRPILFVMDELTAVSTQAGGLDAKQVKHVNSLLVDLSSRARSAGISLLWITQQLSTDAIPSAARQNFDARLCHAVATNMDAKMAIPNSTQGDDLLNPAMIGGELLPDGNLSTVGTFVTGGNFGRKKGRAYYIDNPAKQLQLIEGH